jgi:hypothetical protein
VAGDLARNSIAKARVRWRGPFCRGVSSVADRIFSGAGIFSFETAFF